jgi:DNA-binding beta-propeller fold protein YncE
MSLQFLKMIDLPENAGQGGFDHAAYSSVSGRMYVAHTINHALDVIDCTADEYLYAISDLAGVAGALVSDERKLVMTSNRGENTVGIFPIDNENALAKVPVGVRPNGLSFDWLRGHLLAANVGDPFIPGSFTVSIVDVHLAKMIASIPVPGRTRWTIFDPKMDCFYVNIADPFQIIAVSGAYPFHIERTIPIPARGPHGLDIDPTTNRLFCACDEGKLFVIDAASGNILASADLSGTPDVIFFNASLRHLYVAVGDPGVMDVFETDTLRRIESIPTGKGAHTLGFDFVHDKVYAFLPQTHQAMVFRDL